MKLFLIWMNDSIHANEKPFFIMVLHAKHMLKKQVSESYWAPGTDAPFTKPQSDRKSSSQKIWKKW